MGKVPVVLRRNIATNIRNCRVKRYPMRGGSKQCAKEFGVSPQQWSQWERGAHMPDEFRMRSLAEFFGVSTAFLRRDNSNLALTRQEGEEEPAAEWVEAQPLPFPQYCFPRHYVIQQDSHLMRVTVEWIS